MFELFLARKVPSELVAVPWQILSLEHRPNDTQHELVFQATVEKISNFYIRILPVPKHFSDKSTDISIGHANDEESNELVVENSVSIPKIFIL